MRTDAPVNRVTTASELAAMETKPPTKESVPFTIRTKPALAEYLTELAWQQRRSRSELVAEILTDFAERTGGESA